MLITFQNERVLSPFRYSMDYEPVKERIVEVEEEEIVDGGRRNRRCYSLW